MDSDAREDEDESMEVGEEEEEDDDDDLEYDPEEEEDLEDLDDLIDEEELAAVAQDASTLGILPNSTPTSSTGSASSTPVPGQDDYSEGLEGGITIGVMRGRLPPGMKRGPGRPRKGPGSSFSHSQQPAAVKKWPSNGSSSFARGTPLNRGGSTRGGRQRREMLDLSLNPMMCDVTLATPSPPHELIGQPQLGSLDDVVEPETPNPTLDKLTAPEELPPIPEKWPGKVCALCNLGEKSTLGQGELLQLSTPEGFNPDDLIKGGSQNQEEGEEGKSPHTSASSSPAVLSKRKTFKNFSTTNEPVDELAIIGYTEEPPNSSVFEITGLYYVHEGCAKWSAGVEVDGEEMQGLERCIVEALTRKCSHCSRFGATVPCQAEGCSKYLHLPCAAASACFQDMKTKVTVCSQHLHLVPLHHAGDVACNECCNLGNIHNLVMCSRCGIHYHGSCHGIASSGTVRAGWQCQRCRSCQACRVPSERTKLLICDDCDKAYHPQCLRPHVGQIPKHGWKCKNCRICSDCGARTPGAGHSSRWHAHFTVCDSCYQQRNKGQACPICGRAYRHVAHREMVQCHGCKRFVHGTCDPDAELSTYQTKKASTPDYQYSCPVCKMYPGGNRPGGIIKRNNSIDDTEYSQDSYYMGEDSMSGLEADDKRDADSFMGLGKGKPYYASKVAKKKLGLAGMGMGINRPKGGIGKVGLQKRQRGLPDFGGRKRGPKAKMRGVFGVPGVGLQGPQADSSRDSKRDDDDEPGGENRLVLCSAKDKFVLNQDVCVMCGSLGADQEGCLIACAQCGQCYHPYCINVKVTKVILQKGWRCLDCTVCEGCGQRNDESRLILCDDCDISFHIYCMDPPLDYVPQGNWKCKWCAQCQMCGSNDPGFNCSWMNSFSECGPCASLSVCPACNETYGEGDLIIQCVQCERWVHGGCDQIRSESDAERCADEGYNCVLCRPRDVPPPHLIPLPPPPKPPTPIKSPETPKLTSQANYFLDGVCLSEIGHHQIKSLVPELPRKKRRNTKSAADTEAGILATIESVIAGDEEAEEKIIPREGTIVQPRADGTQPIPPEGFTIYTTESGIMVLRRKRQRNLHKLGIGGFAVRTRGTRPKDEEGWEGLSSQATTPTPGATPESTPGPPSLTPPSAQPPTTPTSEEKPKRKPQRKKPRNKIMESFPVYIQEAFFGRELLDCSKEKDHVRYSSDSEEEKDVTTVVSADKTIQLSQEELRVIEQLQAKEIPKETVKPAVVPPPEPSKPNAKVEPSNEEEDEEEEALKDILPNDLLDGDDLVDMDTLMADDDDITKTGDNLDDIGEAAGTTDVSNTAEGTKDELTDILSPHFNLESMVRESGLPNMDSKDVEEIFKGVLTDESQESQESVAFPLCGIPGTPAAVAAAAAAVQGQHGMISPSPATQGMPTGIPRNQAVPLPSQQSLASPSGFPTSSPYHSEYSNSPQFSPAFSEPPSPWLPPPPDQSSQEGMPGPTEAPTSYNQRSAMKMESDELLGGNATISSVLYCNINHPEWKTEFPTWSERCKQILKKWRALAQDKKAPYLQQARENRAKLRMKKSQQIPVPPSTPSTSNAGSTSNIIVKQEPSTSTSIRSPSSSLPSTSSTMIVNTLTMKKPAQLLLNSTNIINNNNQKSPITATEFNTIEDQDKILQQQKSSREAEQERQWKQLQAMRQQQQQQQQQVIHEQRTQGVGLGGLTTAMARVHRQMVGDTSQLPPPAFLPDGTPAPSSVTSQLHVTTGQDAGSGPMASPSPGSRPQFTPPLKVNRVLAPPSPVSSGPFAPPPSPRPELPPPSRPGTMPPRSLQQQQAAAAGSGQFVRLGAFQQDNFSPNQQSPQEEFPGGDYQREVDPYAQAPLTPRPQPQQRPSPNQAFQQRPVDPYAQPPGTPRPQPTQTAQQTFIPPAAPPPSPSQQQQRQIFSPRQVDPYAQPPGTPRPVDPYAQPPGTPRPGTGADDSGFHMPQQPQPEVNKQLRELLQRQQFKKLEQEQLVPGQSTRIWPQEDRPDNNQQQQQAMFEGQQTVSQPQQSVPGGDNTFRHPLPPGMRPRVPVSPGMLIRGPGGQPMRHTVQVQNLDPRMRLLIQQQQQQRAMAAQGAAGNQQQQFVQPTAVAQQTQQFVAGAPTAQQQQRMPGPRNPLDPYDHLVQQRQQQQMPFSQQQDGVAGGMMQQRQQLVRQVSNIEQGSVVAGMVNPGQRLQRVISAPPVMEQQQQQQQQILQQRPANTPTAAGMVGLEQTATPPQASPTPASASTAAQESTQEIPESVTAELEKLEQDGGMEPLEVGPGLLELGDDDDELLGMGNDFNILEYADPELDRAPGGGKTNILDFDLSEEHTEDKKEAANRNQAGKPIERHSEIQAGSSEIVAAPQNTVPEQTAPQAATQHILQPPPAVPHTLPQLRPGLPQQAPQQQQQQQFQPGFVPQQQQQLMRQMTPAQMQAVQQRLQMRMNQQQQQMQGQQQRMVNPASQMLQRMGVKPGGQALAPPPPPYPGPPPPYPGPQQQGTLQEQPLLLEELLEQEKREQERQQQAQAMQDPATATDTPGPGLLSDMDFERLRADVLRTPTPGGSPSGLSPPALPVQGVMPMVGQGAPLRPPFPPTRPPPQQWVPTNPQQGMDQQVNKMIPIQRPGMMQQQMMNQPVINPIPPVPNLPAPPVPPEVIVTEQDRQMVVAYEQWLGQHHQALSANLKALETEVNKLRKVKKSLSSKQRQLRKSGQELQEADGLELERITREQSGLQKQLEQSRKQNRLHGTLLQDYRTKQQKRQQAAAMMSGSGTPSPGAQIHHSPLGPPPSVPPASPSLSPSPALMQQSPLHSPVSHSPGLVQSPNTVAQMSPRSLQPSPRLQHSQMEDGSFSPSSGPMSSPQGPVQRLASPQGHRMPSPQAMSLARGQPGQQNQQFSEQMRVMMTQRFVRNEAPQQAGGPGVVMGPGPRPRMAAVTGGQGMGPLYLQQQQQLQQMQMQQSQMQQNQQQIQQLSQQMTQNQQAMQMQQNQQVLQQQQQQNQMQNQQQLQQQNQQAIQQMQQNQMQNQQQMQQQNQMQNQQQLQQNQMQNQQQMQQNQMQNQQQMHPDQQSQLQQQLYQQSNMRAPQNFQAGQPQQQQQQQQQAQRMQQQNMQFQGSPIGSPQHQQIQQRVQGVPFPASPLGSPQTQQQRSMAFPQSPLGSPQPMRVNPSLSFPQSPLGSPQMRVPASPLGSPQPNIMMQNSPMRRHSGNSQGPSPLPPERPLSTENPHTPRTPSTPFTPQPQNEDDNTGGGNPNNNPLPSTERGGGTNRSVLPIRPGGGGSDRSVIPFIPPFGRFGYFKLGLRGGSPLWTIENGGLGAKKPAETQASTSNVASTSAQEDAERLSIDSDVEAAVLSNMKDLTVVVVGSSPASSCADDLEQSLESLEEKLMSEDDKEMSLDDVEAEIKKLEPVEIVRESPPPVEEDDKDKTTSIERPSTVTHSSTDTPASPDPENLGPPDPEPLVGVEDILMQAESPGFTLSEIPPSSAHQANIGIPGTSVTSIAYPMSTRLPQISFTEPEVTKVSESLVDIVSDIKPKPVESKAITHVVSSLTKPVSSILPPPEVIQEVKEEEKLPEEKEEPEKEEPPPEITADVTPEVTEPQPEEPVISESEQATTCEDTPVKSSQVTEVTSQSEVTPQIQTTANQTVTTSAQMTSITTQDVPITSQDQVSTPVASVPSQVTPVSTQIDPVVTPVAPISNPVVPVSTQIAPVLTQNYTLVNKIAPISTQSVPTLTQTTPIMPQMVPITSQITTQMAPISSQSTAQLMNQIAQLRAQMRPTTTQQLSTIPSLITSVTSPQIINQGRPIISQISNQGTQNITSSTSAPTTSAVTTQMSSATSQIGTDRSEPSQITPQATQVPITTQIGPITSQLTQGMSHSGPTQMTQSMSHIGPTVTQTAPIMSQMVPVTTQMAPITSQVGQITTQMATSLNQTITSQIVSSINNQVLSQTPQITSSSQIPLQQVTQIVSQVTQMPAQMSQAIPQTASITQARTSSPFSSFPQVTSSNQIVTKPQPAPPQPPKVESSFSVNIAQAIETVVATSSELAEKEAREREVAEKVRIEKEKIMQMKLSETIKKELIDSSDLTGCKLRPEESHQNVLLKQLLQNTACSTQPSVVPPSTVPSLEAQLARPVPPTPSPLIPPLISESTPAVPAPITTPVVRPSPPRPQLPIVRPPPPVPMVRAMVPRPEISVKKDLMPITQPMVPQPTIQQTQNMQQLITEVKKEVMDDMQVPQSVREQEERVSQEMDQDSSDKILQSSDVSAVDLKKLKRRQYQQKRRQSLGKEGGASAPKKRARKLSSTSQGSTKVEEDYDGFIDHLMAQLRQLPHLNVLEPELGRNFAVCPVFGSGDLTKLGTTTGAVTPTTPGTPTSPVKQGDLIGSYGKAILPNIADHYNTQPFGELVAPPPVPPVTTQRGFYDQEFSALKLDTDDDKNRDREDSPDTIISSSSPECVIPDYPPRFPGLRLIKDEIEDPEEKERQRRASPVIPIVVPIPIRVRPGITFKDLLDLDKENMGISGGLFMRNRWGQSPPTPLRDAGNVTVTLTLSSAAARDVAGALRGLAQLLRIPPPLTFNVTERAITPPDHKLGLYRTRGRDGKEGAAIDIQSILNGAAKFCRHCDIVILNNFLRKRASDLPLLNSEEISTDDDLYFCSRTCYVQFALTHRAVGIDEKAAAAIVDHLGSPTSQAKHDRKRKAKEDAVTPVEEVPEKPEEETPTVEPMETEEVKPTVDETTQESPRPDSRRSRKHTGDDLSTTSETPSKVWKGIKYKTWVPGLQPPNKFKKLTDKDLTEMLYRSGITVMPPKLPEDSRTCMFCHQQGDGVSDGTARLLNYDVDKWVHLNCALWSDDVYETVNGALMNLEQALQQSLSQPCTLCQRPGATLRCFKLRCGSTYHLGCAVKEECVFYKNKSMYCSQHVLKGEKEAELTTLAVFRRVYVNRDENRQVAAVMHHSDQSHLLRVGGLIFLSVGQLLPHQLPNFHTPHYIYPIGYKIVRLYWSMRVVNKRCRYICSIHDNAGRPEFRVVVQETNYSDLELRGTTARSVWLQILEPTAALRKNSEVIQLFPQFVSGEDLFGLTEPAVMRVLESLPGIETLSDYRFKYGRNPLLELPLAVNPTGCARSEPKLRTHFKRPHTQRTGSASCRPALVPAASTLGEASCPYSKQFVHSKSSQYKKMKQEWRNNVFLARSKIQGLGLYAARDLERHTMVIEYIGEIIRTELAEAREKQYEEKNRGIYMFRLDEERVIDATLSGGLARYINHSCNPNCVAETVEVERDFRIIIFAKRRIARGEELAYDYKFDIEDDQHKIPCLCGAPNCRKWMN